jgi:plasmid stabilization system protein ParE
MAEVRWTIQAADDLEAIVAFVATDFPQAHRPRPSSALIAKPR